MAGKQKESLEEQQQKLSKELEQTHELAKMGLNIGKVLALVAAILLGLNSLFGYASIIAAGKTYISSTDLVIITAIVVVGFLIYFAFIYGRLFSIKAKISETEKQIELEAGGKAK